MPDDIFRIALIQKPPVSLSPSENAGRGLEHVREAKKNGRRYGAVS